MSKEIVTGRDALRAALQARIRKGSSAVLSRDLGVTNEALLGFAENRVSLPTSVLKALALDLFGGHTVYDDAADRLKPMAVEVKPLGVAPEPYNPDATANAYPPRTVPRPGPPPLFPGSTKTPPKKPRPGWL
jgi:hypothetical protein